MTPINPSPAGTPVDYNFWLTYERTDRGNIFPDDRKAMLTYQYEYTQTSYSPTFPANLSEYLNYINGIVDIGFSHTGQ